MATTAVNKKVRLTLVGLDSNAFCLLGAFSRQARKEGWEREEIEAVMEEASSKDYNHLLNTLREHCVAEGDKLSPEDETDDEDEEEEDDEEEDDDFEEEEDDFEDDEDLDDEDLDDEDDEDEEEEEDDEEE